MGRDEHGRSHKRNHTSVDRLFAVAPISRLLLEWCGHVQGQRPAPLGDCGQANVAIAARAHI